MKDRQNGFRELVWEIVRCVPRGRVTTYGRVAALTGAPRAARAVGWVLHFTPEDARVPCQRVVNRYGGLASAYGWGGVRSHAADLLQDGVEVRDDFTVDLERYLWEPEQELVERFARSSLELRGILEELSEGSHPRRLEETG